MERSSARLFLSPTYPRQSAFVSGPESCFWTFSSDSQQTAITRADLDALKAEILGALNLLLRDPVRLSILTAPQRGLAAMLFILHSASVGSGFRDRVE